MAITSNFNSSKYHGAFMMDFENSLLVGWFGQIPKGNKRYLNPEWRAYVEKYVFPHLSDIRYCMYSEWVEAGGGDEHCCVKVYATAIAYQKKWQSLRNMQKKDIQNCTSATENYDM